MILFRSRTGRTKGSVPVQGAQHGLPKRTSSICPECRAVLPASIAEEDGRVVLRKICPQHGEFADVLSRDIELYLKLEEWTFGDGTGLENPTTETAGGCPLDCGVCPRHLSHAALVNIDLTNRCNLRCPICFANANASGFLFEPSFDEVVRILENIRKIRPVPPAAVQFSGGEPTLHPRFLDIVEKAREAGIEFIQVATNGIALAKDPAFAREAKRRGLHTAYLQFDGTDDACYRKNRGVEGLFAVKMRAVKSCREAGIGVVLVPTVVRGINDRSVGDILRFALENADIVDGISYQPVALTGRFTRETLAAERYTIYDLAADLERQTGMLEAHRDFYPLAITSPLSRVLGRITRVPRMTITCHAHCGLGTYIVVNRRTGVANPITRILDVEGLFRDLDAFGRGAMRIRSLGSIRMARIFRKHCRPEEMPEGLTVEHILEVVEALGRGGREAAGDGNEWWLLLVMGMHFQDSYNFDLERVRRCSVHYAAPDGKFYPFCTYNSGPVHRERVERQFRRAYRVDDAAAWLRTQTRDTLPAL